jgi:hypothetical protein
VGEPIPFVPVRQWVVTLAYRMLDLGDEPRASRMRGGVVTRRAPDDADLRLVRAVLGLLDEQQPVEEAVVDHQPVLVAGPAMKTGSLCVIHGAD